RQCVEALDVNIIPRGGTALAPAIRTALTAFKEGDNFKVLVLMSDGEDHEPGALEAARAAAEVGLKIFTIGIGTPEGDLLRVQDAKGRTDYIRDFNGNVVKSRLNEPLLREIAEATGGFYLPLRGAKTMDTLYEQGLAPLPKTEGQEKLLRRYHERYHWPLGAAILLLILEMLLPEGASARRRSATASQSPSRAPQPALSASTALALMLGASVATALASPRAGLREYQAGQYDRALQEFERALEKRPDDPRLHFNAGAAAYRDRRFDVAADHFAKASTAPDLKLQEDAFYNLGNALYRRGEAAGDPQKAIQDWQAALKQYEHALKLNTNNADARFNHEFVKRRLEELKQQQPPQPQQGQSDQNQPQQNNQQQQQQQQQQAQQQQQGGPPDQSDQPDRSDPSDQRESSPPQPQPSSPQPEREQQPQQTPAQAAPRPMTPEEARQLLDAARNDERVLQFAPDGEHAPERRVFKDW
ncbi:MAG: tetratricopeptide repeat protein, partial [Verrucomicrobiae bacterium]|nr:tetratricopeptide repeat protein [Verrucomicrobiae bacterium]